MCISDMHCAVKPKIPECVKMWFDSADTVLMAGIRGVVGSVTNIQTSDEDRFWQSATNDHGTITEPEEHLTCMPVSSMMNGLF